MKSFINFIVLYLVTFQMAFGQTLINTDQVEIGKKGSTAVKQLKFRTTNQKSLSADYSTEGLSYDGNSLSVGDGTASNKTIKFNKGASSPEIRFNNSTGKLEFSNDASLYKDIGSGSGGTKNYITEADGTSQGSWTTYADAAQATPVDGTGGVPTVTYVASTDSTMRGTTNFLFTHPASNVQGNGFSYNFTIDPADKGKVLQGSFEYKIDSGTFTDNDIEFWLYYIDGANSKLIPVTPSKLKNSGIIERFFFEFQSEGSPSSTLTYRLIGHVATATATAYTLRFTNWNVGPQAKLYGSPITDWVTYTPTGAWTTNTTYTGRYRRVGQNIEVEAGVTLTGAPNAANFTLTLPSGLSIDANKLSIGGADWSLGTAQITNSGVSTYLGIVRYISGVLTSVSLGVSNASGTYDTIDTTVSSTVPHTFKSGDNIIFHFSVPIAGWSSSQVMSSDAATSVVSATSLVTGGALPANNSPIIFTTVTNDTLGAYSTSTGLYTAKSSGVLRASGNILISHSATTGQYINFSIRKNGTSVYGGSFRPVAGTIDWACSLPPINIPVIAGDTIGIYYDASSVTTPAISANGTSSFSIERISGPSQIMASESVSALYTGAPPTGTFNGSSATVFGTKVKDSHNAYNTSTGSYTIPTSGTYDLLGQIWVAGTFALNNYVQALIYVDGVLKYSPTIYSGGSQSSVVVPFSISSIPLLAGQVVTIRTNTTATGPSFAAGADQNYFSIKRSGNY